MMLLASSSGLLHEGFRLTLIGFIGAASMTFLGRRFFEPKWPTRRPGQLGRWRGARQLRLPLLLVGVAGIIVTMVATL